jgi:hypothetical protein
VALPAATGNPASGNPLDDITNRRRIAAAALRGKILLGDLEAPLATVASMSDSAGK